MAQLTVRIATPDYASLTDDDGKPLIRPEVLREMLYDARAEKS